MNIYRNNIGVEVSPTALRIASLLRRGQALYLSAVDETRLPYDNFDDLHHHAKECGVALNELFTRNNIHSGKCIAAMPTAHTKTKCVAFPLMQRRALLRMVSSRHFWHKHLGVSNDAYSYARLTTVHDKTQYRMSLYLMAAPAREIAFYKDIFAHTRLSLSVLTLSTLAYYGIHRHQAARHLLIIKDGEAYFAHFGQNVFSYQTILLGNNNQDLKTLHNEIHDDAASNTALHHLSESLQERLRSEKVDEHTLWLASNLKPQATEQLNSSLADITLKPLNVCKDIKLAPQLKTIPAAMHSVIALARWLATDSKTFKREVNFIHDHSAAYYKSAVCWILSLILSLTLFFYYQHLAGLNAAYQPMLQYQIQLSSQQNEYKNKLKAMQQRTKHQKQLQTRMQLLSKQHHLAVELWSHLAAFIPQSIKIETIDCQWPSSCLIIAKAQDYGQIIHFADQIKKLETISEVVIDNSQAIQDQSTDAMRFTLACKLNFSNDTAVK